MARRWSRRCLVFLFWCFVSEFRQPSSYFTSRSWPFKLLGHVRFDLKSFLQSCPRGSAAGAQKVSRPQPCCLRRSPPAVTQSLRLQPRSTDALSFSTSWARAMCSTFWLLSALAWNDWGAASQTKKKGERHEETTLPLQGSRFRFKDPPFAFASRIPLSLCHKSRFASILFTKVDVNVLDS